jgi:hypothetical protein
LLGKRTEDLAGKLEDFEFRATYTIVQHLQFFEKKSEKSKRNLKHIPKNTKLNGGIKF